MPYGKVLGGCYFALESVPGYPFVLYTEIYLVGETERCFAPPHSVSYVPALAAPTGGQETADSRFALRPILPSFKTNNNHMAALVVGSDVALPEVRTHVGEDLPICVLSHRFRW